MNTKREATRDAHELARATMFYGEGAGIRRKLIRATVQEKMDRNPKYAEIITVALGKEDMAAHARAAHKERKRLDRFKTVKKTSRAITSGNYRSAPTGLVILAVVGFAAHETGYDKIALEKAKKEYYKGKAYVHYKWSMHKARPKVQNVTNISAS